MPQYRLVHPLEFGIYAVLGVVGGLVSVAFTKLLLGMRQRFLRFPQEDLWFQPVAGGVDGGPDGLVCATGSGRGIRVRRRRPEREDGAQTDGLLVVLKLLGVTTSYASGNAGGIFGPACLSAPCWEARWEAWRITCCRPTRRQPGAYALVGMGALFAGIVRAPMTSVLMIFETTRDYAVIVPLMIANLVSFFISSRLQRQPIYEALALQDGIHLPTAETRQRYRQHQVINAMRAASEILPAQITVREALERVRSSTLRTWPVIDERGVVGVISLATLEGEYTKGTGTEFLKDLVDAGAFPHVHKDQALDLALERMGAARLELLPVVSRADMNKLEGIITLRDVLDSYGVGPVTQASSLKIDQH